MQLLTLNFAPKKERCLESVKGSVMTGKGGMTSIFRSSND